MAAWSRLLDVLLWLLMAPYLMLLAILTPVVGCVSRIAGVKVGLALAGILFLFVFVWEFYQSENSFIGFVVVFSAGLLAVAIVLKRLSPPTDAKSDSSGIEKS